jgi:hypothetical protein
MLASVDLGEHFSALAGAEGIEPPSTVLETVVVPFNYTPSVLFGLGNLIDQAHVYFTSKVHLKVFHDAWQGLIC